ncbi:uncharacterized protein lrrc66 [Hippocampus comes]|uniref:uncharacterized protein lrrc66 n=1 Tax=Hippocampus comes TaxID=109280 RepID=UPI00094F205A|nr:PREDICTED: leucine-rich repeat-containing protein 66 [Hippocampus comes]
MIKMARVPIVSVLLLTCFVLHCHSLICPPSCSCRGTSVLNCSLAGLWTMPKIPDSVAHLDVSHNGLERVALLRRTLPRLRSLSLVNNSIARLSLCIHGRVQGRGCASWAPNLHLLSVERNQLRRLPRGLSALEALEVLRLSFNSITTIQLGELDNLRGLRELHLQHNLISSLHSDAFRHLQQLKILNVSFNMLTSLNPSIYLSLHTIGADVHLAGNRWRCDCNMRSIRRWMALDRSRGSRSWDLVCASPPILAGVDIVKVEDDDLNCWSAEKEPKLHQDVTVHRDSQVLLSCATKGGLWRTPAGLVPANQPQSGLLVSAITEKNTGLYVCLSEDYQVVSVFHLHIAGTSRKARSVTERITGGERSQTVTQSDFTLAVCLSVFITFLVAFILGVLLRPCIDMLWKRITRKKTSNPVSSAEERQYDNEAYSAGEDPEELRPHRERRVTFSTVDFQEENNVKYHNKERETKANGTVVECEMVTDGDSGSEISLERRYSEDTRGLSDQNLKRRGSLSDSSLSDKDQKEVDTVQQNSTELPPISINKTPGFAFEPILHPNNGRILAEEPEDDEEQFEFSDCSTSPRTSSPVGSYNYTKQIMPRLNRKDSSNSSSYMSDDEPSEYTVNPDLQEEEDMRRRYAKSGHEPSLDQDTELWWPAVDLEHSMRVQRRLDIKVCEDDRQTTSFGEKPGTEMVVTAGVTPSIYLSSSDSEETRRPVTVSPRLDSQTQRPALDLEHTISVQRYSDIKAPLRRSDSSSGTDSEDGSIHLTEAPQKFDRAGLLEQEVRLGKDTRWPAIDLQRIPRIERHLNVKSTLPDSSSSSDSEVVRRTTMLQPPSKVSLSYDAQATWPAVDLEDSFQIKRRLDVKATSPTLDASIDSDSDDVVSNYITKPEQETRNVTRYPIKAPPTPNYYPQSPWPSIDLEDSFRIKRRLNVKILSPPSDSPSIRNRDYGTTHDITKQEQGLAKVTRSTTKASSTPSYYPHGRWPTIDLEDSFRIKRRLNVKGPPSPSDSSSSSDSEHETIHHITKHEQRPTQVTRYSSKELPTPNYDPHGPWPTLNLEDSFRIKRRLNVKATSPTLDASSDSDSDDVVSNYITKPEQVTRNVTRYPIKAAPTPNYDPHGPWPTLNLEDSFRIKRRLNVKATSPTLDASSDSDSDDVVSNYITKPEQVTRNVTRYPIKAAPTPNYDPHGPWPTLNLEDSFRIKRRLNVKATSPTLDASSDSDSDDVVSNYITKPEQVTRNVTRYPIKAAPTPNYDPHGPWPTLNLEDSFRIKRRLNVKATSPTLDASSDSDSDDVVSNYITKPEQVTRNVTRYPIKAAPTPNYDPHGPWPTLNLEDSFRIKRRLNVKATSPTLDASSDSDSDDVVSNYITKPEQVTRNVTRYPIKAAPTPNYDPHGPWPTLNLEDSFRIKRRLNVKATSPTLDASSDSDSDDVVSNYITKPEQVTRNVTRYPIKAAPTPNYDPHGPWPTLNLEDSFRIKRRLNVKATSPTLDASSDSDSDDVVSNYITKPEQVTRNVTRYPIKAAPTPNYDPQSPWPAIDLEDSFRIKRRLNVKVLSPRSDSSSSRNRDHGTTHYITKQEQGLAKVTKSSLKASSTPSYYPHGRWPTLDLEDSFRIKRRLNVKGPPSPSDSSSYSDSEHETIHHVTKHEQSPTQVTRYYSKESPTPNYDPHAPWPTLNLDDSFRIKRRLDIKARSTTLDAPSDSDNNEVVTNYIIKPEQETRNVTRYPIKAPPTPTYDPQSPWPSIDLEDSFRIKKRLNVKVLSPPSDSPSIRNRDYGTTHDITKQEQGLAKVTRSTTKASSTPSYYPHGRWPTLDLEDSFRIKRRLNVKGPPSPSDSSSYSDSEHETIHHVTKHEQSPTQVTRYYSKESPTPNYDPHAPWPTLNLADSFRIKRRLDVKATSPTLDASSDTDMTNRITELEQETIKLTRYPMTAPSKQSYDPESPWPSIDLEDSFKIKRRLNVKGPSPPSDSLSSSNSEHETIQHITKHEQRPTHVTRYSSKESPTPNYDPHANWPTLNLEDSFRIKRRLDVQITSPTLDVSSDSESDDEVSNYITKPDEETRKVTRYPMKAPPTRNYDTQSPWPSIDLEDSFRIKRRLNVKGPSPPSDSLSSSNSEHETIQHITKHEQRPTHVTRYSSKESPTPNYDPHATWPTLNLKDSFGIKRRLDVKARSTTLDASSDSDDVMTNYITKPEQETRKVTRYPMKAPPTLNHDTQSPWPSIDLEDSFRIKRRLNVKVLSPPSNSSSSRNRDRGTTHDITEQEQGLAKVTRSSTIASSTPSYYPHGRWPTLDLENSFRIKRRLNIKGPSPPSDSPSSTDSEHETIHHITKHEQIPTHANRYSSKGSPKPNYDPHSPWPTLNLADSFRIKRRLDVKATSTTLDASSDSASDDEVTNHITKPEQDNRKVTRYPIKAPSTSYDPQATWPMVDLDGTFRIKRRLNVKQLSATPDSSSSSNSKNEMTFHPTKQKQGVTNTIRYPMKPSYDPEVPWPSLDFKDSLRIKRRLDFKAPLPTSNLTSSSESEDEKMYYTQKQGQGTTKITSYAPKAPSYGPQSTWPTLDLENSFRIKRRLEINAPSPHSDSLSSSDREYDVTHHIIKQNLGSRKTHHPINVSPRISSDSESSWPSLDLEDSFRIKRRLNFQVLSPTSDLSSITMKQGTANLARYAIAGLPKPGHDPQGLWSLLNLEDSFRIKRRLEIKAPSPASTYSSNSEEDTFVDGQRQGYYERQKGRSSTEPSNVSHVVKQPSSSNEQDDTNADATETQALPRVYLGVNKRLDIKVSSPQQQLAADQISPEAYYSKSNFSTSDSDEENQDEKASLKVADKSSIKSPAIIVPRSPKNDSNIKLEKYVIVPETAADKPSNASPEINSELQSRWANMHLGFSRFRKRLEITSHACEPPVVPLSESDPEQIKQKNTGLGWQGNTRTESPLTAAQVHNNADQPAVGPTSEAKSSVTGLPRIRRYLDVKAPATLKQGLDSSSSSKNEADSTEYSQWRGKPHDLRLPSSYATRTVETQQTAEKSQVATVPRQPSSDSSEDETGEAAEAREMTEVPRSVPPDSDSPIPYRRLIIKPSSLPNDTSTRDQHTDGMTTLHGSSYSTRYQLPSLAPKIIPNPRSGDYMSSTREIYSYTYSARPYTARNQTLYVAPKTIPSLGSGDDDTPLTRDSSDVNIRTTQSGSSYSGRYQIPSLAPRPFRNSTEGPPAAIRWTGLRTRLSDPSKHPDSSLPSPLGELPKTQAGSLTTEVAQENRSTTVTRSLHLGSNSLSLFGTDEMWKGASEKTERKGLRALKAMSDERQTWDKDEKVKHFQPSGNSGNSNQNRSEDLVSYTSASIGEDLPYDILRYRTHALTQEIPPPVPTTPLPDEAVELTRNSKSSYTPSISQV